MVNYTIITFYNENGKVLGRFKSIEDVSDQEIESLLKEHNACCATIEYGARLVQNLNYKIA